MRAYSHLLVAVDLGTGCDALIKRAGQLAELCDAKLSLAHVVEYLPAEPTGEAMLPPSQELEPELIKGAEKQLSEFAARAGAAIASQHIAVGNIPSELARLAADLEVDLLVAGAHEKRGIFFFSGGTERALLKRADCDVLTIRLKDD
ncbi:MAG: universal stress protein [Gammaproteobacteria bacterium]|nr:universal stress protein [Gammaproteobacteria bacterium]